MKYYFTRLNSKAIPNHSYILKPIIDVTFINGTRAVTTKALIDTGADGIIINTGFAKLLNIDVRSGVLSHTKGIENNPMHVYHHTIQMELSNFPNSRFPVQVGFIDSGSVGVLLGRIDFLDLYKVTFEMYNSTFDIEIKT